MQEEMLTEVEEMLMILYVFSTDATIWWVNCNLMWLWAKTCNNNDFYLFSKGYYTAQIKKKDVITTKRSLQSYLNKTDLTHETAACLSGNDSTGQSESTQNV